MDAKLRVAERFPEIESIVRVPDGVEPQDYKRCFDRPDQLVVWRDDLGRHYLVRRDALESDTTIMRAVENQLREQHGITRDGIRQCAPQTLTVLLEILQEEIEQRNMPAHEE